MISQEDLECSDDGNDAAIGNISKAHELEAYLIRKVKGKEERLKIYLQNY